MVLGVDDLPEGWTEVPAEETESGGGCLDALTAPEGPFDLDAAGTDEVSVLVLAATPLGDIDDAVVVTAMDAMLARAPVGS